MANRGMIEAILTSVVLRSKDSLQNNKSNIMKRIYTMQRTPRIYYYKIGICQCVLAPS